MSKPMIIEKAKNLILVVLFLMTVLLLYFFWGNISFDNWRQPSIPAVSEVQFDTSDLIRPEQIVIYSGVDDYTVITQGAGDIWNSKTEDSGDSIVKEIDRFGQAENIYAEEITGDQFQEVMKFRSLLVKFGYDIPISDFYKNFGMEEKQSYSIIDTVTQIGYSTASDAKNSLLIYDGKNKKYYRLVADANDAKFGALIDNIESQGYNTYYPVKTFMEVNNNTLIPLNISTNLREFPFLQNVYSYQTEKINSLAEEFFGGNFDFVRKITEDKGTVIYMYGYGQTVLIVNTDGSMEYKEEENGGNSGQSFLGALNTAVQFIAEHGSWGAMDGERLTPYLLKVKPDPNDTDGYQFTFGTELNGAPVFYQEGDPIVIHVTKGQVTYYKRNFIDIDQKELNNSMTEDPKDTFDSRNLIAQNYQYIYDILYQAGAVSEPGNEDAMFNNVASLISNMQIGYLRPAEEKAAELQPVWDVTFNNNIEIYFDLYTAEPLSYSIK